MRYVRLGMTAALLLGSLSKSTAQPVAIDAKQSVMTVHVSRTGALSAFGHDHEVSAPITSGAIDAVARHVELRVDAKALRVQDPGVSEKDRAEIQQTMLGAEVLDVAHHPEIVFRSVSVEPTGAGSWKVLGNLALHGMSQAVTVEVVEKDGQYTGHATIKQTDFGIKPVRVGGGTIRVKDEVRIDFNIRLAH